MIRSVVRALSAGIAAIFAVVFTAACGGGDGISTVTARAWFEPDAIEFGMLRVGDTEEVGVRLRSTGLGSAMVDAVTFDRHGDSYTARNGSRTLLGSFLPESGEADVSVIFSPSTDGDDLSAVVDVRIGDAEATLNVSASARLRAPPTPVVEPTSIEFGDVELGRNALVRFTLVNSGEDRGTLREVRPKSVSANAPFAVTRRGGGNPVPMEVDPDRSEVIDLEAHFVPTEIGTFEEDLELVFDNDASATLHVHGNAVPAGVLTCDAMTLDFGQVERGTMARKPVHCLVTGGAFSVQRIGVTGTSSPLFTVPSPPTSVSANGMLDFEVEFDARGVALAHSGAAEIVSMAGSTTRISLTGEVIPPAITSTDLSITLNWSTDRTDFDVHLVRAGGAPFDGSNDCYYAAKNPDWGTASETLDDPFLDHDNTTGFGPEQINLTVAAEASYDVYVHFYDYSSARPPQTDLSLQINVRGVDMGTSHQTLDVCGGAWRVGKIAFDTTPPTFTPDTMITTAYRSRASARCQ